MYKTDFSQSEYKKIDIRSYSKRNSSYSNSINNISLKPAYNVPPKISNEKKLDLLSICHYNLIPEQHHYFLKN